jgi:hypothetical protein
MSIYRPSCTEPRGRRPILRCALAVLDPVADGEGNTRMKVAASQSLILS